MEDVIIRIKCRASNITEAIPAFVLPALESFGCEQTIRFFQSIGIEPKEKNGYVYPRSMQAASVREALLLELRRQRVKLN